MQRELLLLAVYTAALIASKQHNGFVSNSQTLSFYGFPAR